MCLFFGKICIGVEFFGFTVLIDCLFVCLCEFRRKDKSLVELLVRI